MFLKQEWSMSIPVSATAITTPVPLSDQRGEFSSTSMMFVDAKTGDAEQSANEKISNTAARTNHLK